MIAQIYDGFVLFRTLQKNLMRITLLKKQGQTLQSLINHTSRSYTSPPSTHFTFFAGWLEMSLLWEIPLCVNGYPSFLWVERLPISST